jgi:hypothetical protein
MLRLCPPFIKRSVALSASGMRPTDEAFDLKSANGHLDLAFGVRLARHPPLEALLGACSGHPGRRAHATQVDS